MKTLFINACVRGEDSRSLKLARHLISELDDGINDVCEEICLEKEGLLPLNMERLQKRQQLLEEGQLDDPSFRLAHSFADAGRIVIAAPYWDMSYPSILKIFIENIMVCGITFRYDENGKLEGMCQAQELLYVTTAGGLVSESYDVSSYIEGLANEYWGILRTVTFKAEKLDMQPEKEEKIMAAAMKRIESFARSDEKYVYDAEDTERLEKERKEREEKSFILKNKFLRELYYLIQDINRGIFYNIKPVAAFVVLFTLINKIMTSIVMGLSFQLVRQLEGVNYVGNDNFFHFVFSLPCIAISFAAGIILTYFFLFEVSAIMYAYSRSKAGIEVSLREMFSAGIMSGRRIYLSPKNWPMALLVLILLSVLQFSELGGMGVSVTIPEFIMDYIEANLLLSLLLFAVYITLTVTAFYFIFSIPAFVLDGDDFLNACGKSLKLIKGRFKGSIGKGICCWIVYGLAEWLLAVVLAVLFAFVAKLLGGGLNTFNEQYEGFAPLLLDFIEYVAAPVLCAAFITELYYKYSAELWDRNVAEERYVRRAVLSKTHYTIYAFVMMLMILGTMYVYRDNLYLYIPYVDKPQVAAHRGDSVRCPENTMPAFEKAIEENPDWIELDVHETSDGVIIVSHDDDLSRVSGKKIFVHDSSYEELMQLDVGSWFSEEFSYVRLSTLDEVLKKCKDNVKVQIELKPTEYDHELEEKVIEVIRDNQMEDEVIIISLNADTLKRVKEIAPDITTGYCMAVAWGHIEDLDFADMFTVEAGNASESLVKRVHDEGKELFVWTINDDDNVQKQVYCGVDGILSDDPVMLREAIDEADYSGGMQRIFSFLMNNSL